MKVNLIKPYDVNAALLNPPSKRFMLYRTPTGFRPLLLQSSLFNCYPFKIFNEKKEIVLSQKREELALIIEDINYNFIVKRIEQVKDELKGLEKELANTDASVDTIEKRYQLKGEIQAIKQFLSRVEEVEKGKKDSQGRYAYDKLGISGFDEAEPTYQAKLNEIRLVEESFYTKTEGGTCDSCGIKLPNSIEKHIDFLSLEQVNLCPYCHCCEHLDDSNVYGTMAYLPHFSQEQINLFYHAYYILKYGLEGDANDVKQTKSVFDEYAKQIAQFEDKIKDVESDYSLKQNQAIKLGNLTKDQIEAMEAKYNEDIAFNREKIRQLIEKRDSDPRLKLVHQRRAMMDRKINSDAVNFTYGELFLFMTRLDGYFHRGENILVEYFERVSQFNPIQLKQEYEERIRGEIDDIKAFIQNTNGMYGSDINQNQTKKLFTYNIDSPSSPLFWASFFVNKGLFLQSKLSKEEKLNILTRVSGVRFLPSFERFKTHIKGWVGHYLTDGFSEVLNQFIKTNMRLFDDEFTQRRNPPKQAPKSTEQSTPVDIQKVPETAQTQPENVQKQSENAENKEDTQSILEQAAMIEQESMQSTEPEMPADVSEQNNDVPNETDLTGIEVIEPEDVDLSELAMLADVDFDDVAPVSDGEIVDYENEGEY